MLGLDWADVLESSGLAESRGDPNNPVVSSEEFCQLWNTMVSMSDVPDIPKTLGLRMASGPAIPILFAMTTAPDLETGLSRFARYKHIFGPVRFSISRTLDEFTLRIDSDPAHIDLPPSLSSGQIINMHATARILATRPFSPTRIRLPLPEDERFRLADVFDQIPTAGAPSISYMALHVKTPFVSRNDALWQATENDLKAQALIMAGDSPMTHRVRATILEALGTAEPTLAYVGTRLGMSKSTLFRRLRDEGASFQDLLETTRTELAQRYLQSSDLSNQQIAHLLGYRDTTAFQRAFRRWTGMTPRQLRKTRTKEHA
ncbi:MAG: helix-turn-helix domain-containing protein [Pseudomonadota bacterium]